MIRVYHREEIGNVNSGFVLVAEVDTNDLEKAWCLTQNYMGSWSQGEFITDRAGFVLTNVNYSPLVHVKAALTEINGRIHGLRSTSVGDMMECDGEWFAVDTIGFTKCKGL